jgi:hypothetical protein
MTISQDVTHPRWIQFSPNPLKAAPRASNGNQKKNPPKTLEGMNVQTDSTMLKEKMLCSANQVERPVFKK